MNDIYYIGFTLFIIILAFINLYLLKYLIIYKKLSNRKIKNHNKIRFTKLSKQYLNNTKNDDILDLICYLINYIKENNKNENNI